MRKAKPSGKRILASILAVGMIAGLVPGSALADDAAPTSTQQSAVVQSEEQETPTEDEGTASDPAQEATPAPTAESVPEPTPTATTEGEESTPVQQEASTDSATPVPAPQPEETPAEQAPVNEVATLANQTTHIATYAGQVPAGITWADGVTGETFATAYETVTAQAADGTTYTVEVMPENLVYFVDTTAANGNPDINSVGSTEPYDAVKALVGDALLNGTYDRFSPDENSWGLVDNGVTTKGFSATNDKYVTGVYGSGNTGTVEYRFTLEPGVYTITSGHHDWWDNQNRSMKATVTVDGKTLDAGTIAALAKNQSASHSYSFTVTTAQTVTYTLTPTGTNAAAVCWVGVERTGDAPQDPDTPPVQPTLPEGFGGALEENGGLTYATGAVTKKVSGMDTVFTNNVQWNNANSYHASVSDVSALKSTAFTVLFDVMPTSPSGDTNVSTQRTAFTVGDGSNSLHVLTWDGKFGYGPDNGGINTNSIQLTGAVQNDWNSVALVYHEDNGANGAVEIYINGALAGSVADVGFKLSTMDDLSAMLARSFNTNYLLEGSFDNIVIGNVALDSATAMAETAYRAYQKDHLPTVNTAELEAAVAKAKDLVEGGLTSDRLEAALAAGEELLANDQLTADDQTRIDEAAAELNAAISEVNPTEVTLTKEAVDEAAANENGLTWKGWGMLNGNSTSNLLLDYKAEDPEAYWEMMEYLFGGKYPLFTHIKMEMGNDGNNSTGAEACTMRYEDEEADASRSPGFVMAADAKSINPEVKVSILRWGMPDWVAQKWNGSNKTTEGYEAMYKWYSETIFDAYEKFGYVIDMIDPDTNETSNPDEDFIKWFANRIETETNFPEYFDQAAIDAYHSIRIIASDENKGLQIVPSMRADEDLYNAVDVIGFHYRTNATDDYVAMADVDDKEVWYSEGCATFGYTELQENKNSEYGYESIGGYQSPLALMDSIPNAFMASRRSHYVFQPAIGSFYEGIQYGHKELLSARDPWSGYIHYDPALQMLAHFSRFAVAGWENSNPTQNEIWRMISSASHGSFGGSDNEHMTAGIDGDASYLTLAAPNGEDFSVVFVNNTQNAKTFMVNVEDLPAAAAKDLQVWTTETDSYLKHTGTVKASDGSWIISVPAYSIVTATTLNDSSEEELAMPSEGINTPDRTVLDTDSTGRNADTTDTYLYADDFTYDEEPDMEQYNVLTGTTTVDYMTARGDEPRYMLDTHGAWIVEDGRLTQELSTSVSQWNGGDPATIVGDFRWMNYMASVDVQIPDAASGVWTGLGVRSQTGMNWNQDGYTLRIYGNGAWEFYRGGSKLGSGSVTASADGSYKLQVAANGSTITALIDGNVVYSYEDSNPMDAGRVKLSSSWNKVYFDNLEITTIPGTIPYATSMVDGQDDSVSYEGSWDISQPGGGSADNWYRTLSTSHAAGSSFSFTFAVEGTGFAIVGPNDGGADLSIYVDGAQEAIQGTTTASGTRFETYTLTGLDYAKHTVKVVVNSGTLKIDALYTLGQALEAEKDVLVSVETDLPDLLAVKAGQTVENLPETVEVKTGSGEVKTLPITWNNTADRFTEAYGTGSVTGTVEGGTTAIGVPLTVTIPVEIVPANTVYYIDVVEADPAKLTSTEPYDAVKALLGSQLLNQSYDQIIGNGTWGRVDTDAGAKGYSSTTDKTDTGIYGHDNAAGETLTYQLTLPAGTYVLTSAHREWWNMTRPMDVTLTAEDGTVLASGSISLSSSNLNAVNTFSFTLDQKQKVSYTITATGTQAPVISWLAVEEKTADDLKAELQALVETIQTNVANDQANGVVYAETALEAWQYTGSGATAQKDSLSDLQSAYDLAAQLIADDAATTGDLSACMNELQSIYDNLRTVAETYTSIPGTTGSVIKADTGLDMQAHGGSVLTMVEGTSEGCVNYDLDGDGEVTEGKTVYLWYGEDKTNDTRPVDGVRCYVSTDLYNWSDRGTVLYTQDSILPVEDSGKAAVTSNVGSDGEGTTQNYNAMQVSLSNLDALKEVGTWSEPQNGMSESDFIEIKNFLRAYVAEFEVAPTDDHDVSWVAKSYDETEITASSFLYPDSQTEGTQTTTSLQLAFEGLYGGYCITERPKVVYNETSGQYVMVFHADGPLYNSADLNSWVAGGCQGDCPASRYSRAMVGFAVSDTPFGPFKLVNITRMNYDLDLNSDRLGEARDMTVFVDKGVDSNGDGVDDAYVIYSSEMNSKLYVSLLNADYTGPVAAGDTAEAGTQYASRILSDDNREAPAMFKYDGWYYLITSGTDGWNSTEHVYYRSQNILSGWEKVGNPAVNDTGKCFNTQVTYVIPVDAENGKFIFMADRWNGNDLSDSRTVWLPLQVNDDHTIGVLNETNWVTDRLDQLAPVIINSELPAVVYADGSNLPDALNVTWQGKTLDTRVTWSGYDNMGYTTLTATLEDCEGVTKRVTALVMPEDLLYFANPTSGEVSADYTAIVEASADTLKQDPAVNDGAYSEETGFGYTGDGYSVRENTTDIYQSLRYGNSKTASINYRFDLPEGEYEVYVGMYDPASWSNWSPKRSADIQINGTVVEEGYSYYNNCNNTNDTLHYQATVGEDGQLNVTVAPNASTDSAIQVSFIMVAGKPAEKATVRFESNGGNMIASQNVVIGQTATQPANPTRDLYQFTGWYTDEALTALYDFSTPVTGNITLYAGWKQVMVQDIEDLTEVPADLQNTYATVDEMKQAMLLKAEASLQMNAEGSAYYDVKLYYVDDAGNKTPVEDGKFPAEGVNVTFAYPDGTNRDDYVFSIVHQCLNGNLETFSESDITFTDAGLTVHVNSLSPFVVAWRERSAEPTPENPDEGGTTPPDQGGSGNQSGSGSQSGSTGGSSDQGSSSTASSDQNSSSQTSGNTVLSGILPQTGDPAALGVLAVIVVLAAAAIVVLQILRRRKGK